MEIKDIHLLLITLMETIALGLPQVACSTNHPTAVPRETLSTLRVDLQSGAPRAALALFLSQLTNQRSCPLPVSLLESLRLVPY